METSQKFIYHYDTDIVTLTTTTMSPTSLPIQNITLRTVTLGPLGFPMLPSIPPLPDITDFNPLPDDTTLPILAGVAGFLPLWFLIGKSYRPYKE